MSKSNQLKYDETVHRAIQAIGSVLSASLPSTEDGRYGKSLIHEQLLDVTCAISALRSGPAESLAIAACRAVIKHVEEHGWSGPNDTAFNMCRDAVAAADGE